MLLRDTVRSYCAQVADPVRVCLSVDGEHNGAGVAQEVAKAYGTSLQVSRRNAGKLAAVRHGTRALLENQDVAYVAAVDQDGDHFANELLSFLRVAEQTRRHVEGGRVLVLGQRSSRHRPMGFLRGELEGLAGRVLLDALAYRAALTGHPLRLEYVSLHGECPDFHSGYKLFDRATAAQVFLGEPQKAGVSDECYYRHACEAVMVVEALESGAYLGSVNRSTINGQPVSAFGRLDQSRVVADMIIWPCKRLGVPLPFVEQWMANHAQRLLLGTLAPRGVEELGRIRELVLAAYERDYRPKPILRPLFL